jgi:CIC family chloride channel protein
MTRDYAVIVPLMIANLTSLFISRRFQKQPIYEALAEQDGIHLPSPGTLHGTSLRTVGQVMQAAPEVFSARMTVKEAMERARFTQIRVWPVAEDESFLGMLTIEALERAFANRLDEVQLQDLAETLHHEHVHMDHALHMALERMSASHLDVLPVLHRADIHRLLGVVTLKDVLDSYGVSGVEDWSGT